MQHWVSTCNLQCMNPCEQHQDHLVICNGYRLSHGKTALDCRLQQKAAGQKDASSPRKQADPSPSTASAQGKAPSAPYFLSQPPAPNPAPGRVSAPGDVAGLPGGPQQTGSMQPGPVNVQQLQSSLLRPAVHPIARLSPSGSLQGASFTLATSMQFTVLPAPCCAAAQSQLQP